MTTGDQDSYADEYRPAPYREDEGLQRDVQALNGKIDRLQADVEARNRPKPDAGTRDGAGFPRPAC